MEAIWKREYLVVKSEESVNLTNTIKQWVSAIPYMLVPYCIRFKNSQPEMNLLSLLVGQHS